MKKGHDDTWTKSYNKSTKTEKYDTQEHENTACTGIWSAIKYIL